MGTNENVNKLNEKIEKNNDVSIENTGGQVTQDTIDMQATQRIDVLGELQKDTSEATNLLFKKQQGNIAPQKNEEINVEINEEKIQNSGSDNSVEPIAQAENSSANEISNENVQKNPNEIEKNDNTQTVTQEEKIHEQNIEKKELSAEEIAQKEKKHAQDKKDFRLERMLFQRINVMQGKIKESLELIQKYERIDAKEGNLPNIVTTLHDKLTQEVIKQFRTVGIEFNMKSFLVQSIVSDLLGKFEEGISEFRNCSENLNFVREVQEDFESRVELAPTSKVKTFFARIRGIFKPERKQEKLEQLERERQEQKLEKANIHLIKYKFINSELAKYTIKNNIVGSLSKEILHGQGSGLTLNVNDFFDKKINPEMQKLGLDNKLPELHEKIYVEYRLKDEGISKENFEAMSIGEIRKNMKMQKEDLMRSKIVNVVNQNKITMTSRDEEMVI